jgi:flagellar FliJ protein
VLVRFQFAFQNILELKEREKDEILAFYEKAVDQFEKAAKKLYELLKKKEELEHMQSKQMETGSKIGDIRMHHHFSESMMQSIAHWQSQVVQARERMAILESKLVESNMEVKKYEKLKGKKERQFLQYINGIENIQLDEMAAVQYVYGKKSR